jgi:hypothetical protein
MITLESKNFKVEIHGNDIIVTKKAFNDRYHVTLDINNQLVAKSSLALAMAIRARSEIGF